MKVIEAKAAGRYRLDLTFDDGTRGVVDLTDLAGKGIFREWEDDVRFADVTIGAMGEVVWSCGIDLCPDSLYLASQEAGTSSLKSRCARGATGTGRNS